MLTLDAALLWTARLVALAVALQTLELLQIRRCFADDGVWRTQTLVRDYAELPKPVRGLLERVLAYEPFIAILALRLIASLLVLVFGWLQPLPLLLITSMLICVRFRGTYNGGSDYMTILILLALSVAVLAGQRSQAVLGALGYVAVQVTLSYVIAGMVKLKEADWRSGRALQALLGSSQYGAPGIVARFFDNAALSRVASWLVIAFECGFAAAWLGGRACLAMILLGTLFHVWNSAVLGLNRFLFAWFASYPALLYFGQLGPL
jgi:hypothetical protein